MLKNINPNLLLAIGILTMTATHMSYNIDIIAWIAYVPFLIYLSLTKGLKSRLLFVVALILAWSLVTAKIITPPIPYAMVFLYAIPISLFHLPAYLIWDKFKQHKGSFILFPAILTLMEWLQYTFTPFASWGAAAYTQAHSIAIVQTVSLLGMAGLSFLIYWVNISITEIILTKKLRYFNFQIPILALILLILFGTARLYTNTSKQIPTMTVAAVGTDSAVSGLPLPSKESNDSVKNALFERTKRAANNHAQLIVWNEAAVFILPDDEAKWQAALSTLAAEHKISLVASYVVPISITPLKYENKYLYINSIGAIDYTYHKHQPVPGEPSAKGKELLKVFDIAGSKISGAICYDYDFPYLAKEIGQLKADIVAIPSSDWRGIDPLHSQMAAFRAIEQGHSIIRSTRFGLSAAITPYGEMVAQMSSFDKNDKIMTAELPVKSVATVYSIIGDAFIYLCMGFIAVFWINSYIHTKNSENTQESIGLGSF
jgi:apolipoprotein N-acyltransferase